MKRFTFLALLIVLGFLRADEKAKPPVKMTLPELREALGSEDFKVRDQANEQIWGMGDEALVFLAELQNGDDPELAARAERLRRKIRVGIGPETPAELAAELELYGLTNEENTKKRIIRYLTDNDFYEYLLRLRSLEADEKIQEYLDETITRVLPSMLRKHLIAGETEQARVLLKIGSDFTSMIRYGSFLQQEGELDAEIELLKDTGDEELQARYLAYLRVKGDLPVLRSEAARLGDELTEATAALLMGDYLPLVRYQLKNKNHSLVNQIYLKWLLARSEGDTGRMERLVSSLKTQAVGGADELQARANLYRMGLAGVAKETIAEDDWATLRFHYQLMDRYEDDLETMGLKVGESVPEKWLAEKKEAMLLNFRQDQEGGEPLNYLFQAGRFYENRGEIEKSAAIFKVFFDGLRKIKDEERVGWSESVISFSPRGGTRAIAREVDEFDLNIGEFVAEVYGSEGHALWLYNLIKEEEPGIGSLKMLQLMSSFFGVLDVPLKEFELWNERIKTVAMEAWKKGEPKAMGYLLSLWQDFGRASQLWEIYEIEGVLKGEEYRKAYLAVQMGKREVAFDLYREMKVDPARTSPGYLYLKGLAIRAGGDEDAAGELLEQAHCFGLGDSSFLRSIAFYHENYGESVESYELMKKAFLRSEKAVLETDYSSSNLVYLMGERLLAARKWKEAAAMLEAAAIASMSSSPVAQLRARLKADCAHGMLAFEEGRPEEGRKWIEEAHANYPVGGSLADEFFPAMREAGLIDLHDRLCQKTLEILRKNVRDFPLDASSKNSFAWVASRANRNLEEAEEMMKEALELDPTSAAMLDTMGEVQFALGRREEAVKWSLRSVDQAVSEVAIRNQLRRFRTGEFPKD
ncbi:MAG: hypothetical protein ACSHYF_12000 [Verrucomicrobiaceae bacterium]